MLNAPEIIVTSSDFDRLSALLASVSSAHGSAAERLEQELHRARIVPCAQVPADVVTMHSVVSFVDEQSGATHDARLVYPRESAGRPGDVSILSPVGAALLGLSIGQTIEWPLPGGRTTRFRVTGVAQA